MGDIRWLRCTIVMTFIYLFITILVSFYKPDFVNLACATIAIYLLSNLNAVKPKYFRALVALIILSMGYDILWFFMKYRAMSGDADEEDGGMEKALRKFSLTMATIAFFFKIIMCFVFWKTSIDLVKSGSSDEERKRLLD